MTVHHTLMQRAIVLAQRGQNTTTPNPNVGCVITKDGHIIGEGFHQQAGQPHAEINALKNTIKNGHSPIGSTAYVTLEPCSHHGRTPPCANALIDAGVAEVIVGSQDPNPQVSGRGIERLRQAGITVVENILADECDELNRGFFKRMKTGMPWVTVKLGMTIDAKIATESGESQWITGADSRADVQKLRAKSCAVMTSSATVIADNPSLNVRLDGASRQPIRVVVDSYLSASSSSTIFTLDNKSLVYHCSSADNGALSPNISPHATYFSVPNVNNHADLAAILSDLGTNRDCNNILVEAGGRFVGALLAANYVDEIIVYTAPVLLGEGARPAFNFSAVAKLVEAKQYYVQDCCIIGSDVKTTYRKLT